MPKEDPVRGRRPFSEENPRKVAWLTRGQLHPEEHEEAENSFSIAAAGERAKLTPKQRARLAAQERATNAFVNQKLKKESIMKTLRRVILEGGKNSQVKRTRVALSVQDKLRRGETTTADERDVLKKYRSSIHGMAAGRGLAKARKARRAGDDSEARMHAGGAKWNITRGKRWAGRKDPEQENSNTAYPLTADRVFMFERSTMKAEQRVDEISAEKYDAMSGQERSDYAGKVARRYRRMAAAKQAKDKNFTPDKDLSRPLSAHREIKDKAYARAGRHEELKKLRARRKQPLKSSGMGGRDRGEEMAREAGDRP